MANRLVEELTAKERRRGFEIADAVAELTIGAPDEFAKAILYKTADALRKYYGYSEQEKQALVLKSIKFGASTIIDLTRETHFNRQDVSRIVKTLEEKRSIYLQKLSYSGNGRPASLYFVADPEK